MDEVKILAHAFLSVLIAGTLWRIVTFHFLASNSEQVVHLGKAMTIQY